MKRFLHARAALGLLGFALACAPGCENSKVAWSISPRNQMVAVVNHSAGAVTISYERELLDAAVAFISLESESVFAGGETRIFLLFGTDDLGRVSVSAGSVSRVYVLPRGQATLAIDDNNL